MSKEISQESVNNDKKNIFNKINLIEQQNSSICELISDQIDKHRFYVNFTKSTTVCETILWTKLILDYKLVKKKIDSNKKLHKKIINDYGIIANYLNSKDTEFIEMKIKQSQSKNEIILFNFSDLKKIHMETCNEQKKFVANKNIIKITNTNDKIIFLLEKLLENYNAIKTCKQKIKLLKSKQ